MTADETAKEIKKAKTDSDRQITYDPVGRPEVANLLTLVVAVRGHRPGAGRRGDRRRRRRRAQGAA